MSDTAAGYVRTFTRARERMSAVASWGALTGLGLVIALLLGLLVLLDSAPVVWGWLALLGGVTASGTHWVREAARASNVAIGQLVEIAKKLDQFDASSKLIKHLRSRVTSEDRCNTAEALLQFSYGRFSSDHVKATAASVYSYPTSTLSKPAFLRSALVLLGLFGTVLFFAYALGRGALEVASIEPLFGHLRSALASTLGGIAGSILMGVSVGYVAGQLDELAIETEAFLSGPIQDVLGRRTGPKDVRSETELWELLREEVHHMAVQTAEAYGKMGTDVHAFAVSLQQLGNQLMELPAVQIPPAFERLGESVARFEHASEILSHAVPTLLRAVESASAIIPREVVGAVVSLRTGTASFQEEMAQQVEQLDKAIRATAAAATAGTAAVESGRRELAGSVTRVGEDVRALSDGVLGLGSQVQRVEEGLREVVALAGPLGRIETALQGSADQLTKTAKSIETLLAGVERGREVLERLPREVAALQRVTAWIRRADRAPLMRLLMMPWREPGRLPFVR